MRDHPRPCGEKAPLSGGNRRHIGSPPPMRGKASYISLSDDVSRITPAHAGKSDVAMHLRRSTEDHPRPCGEKYERTFPYMIAHGSPPPMRGKVCRARPARTPVRITPAHAGKRQPGQERDCRAKDHPRPCGEKRFQAKIYRPRRGSPPPMRGKGSPQIISAKEDRITPAHAGKRLNLKSVLAQPQDHPRPCGEKA